jgi:Domain of unknown function (DUF4136)
MFSARRKFQRRKIGMKRLSLLALVLFVLALGTAVAQDVRYNYDNTADFSKFKTYKWVSIKNADQVDELTARQITSAIDAEFAKKGLTNTDSDTADLYIGYQTAVGKEEQLNAYSTGWGYGPGWGPGWYGGGMGMTTTTATTSTIYTGQLDLDIYNAAKKQLVWRGVVSKALNPKANAEKKQKNISKAIAKLLKDYPPKVKK